MMIKILREKSWRYSAEMDFSSNESSNKCQQDDKWFAALACI